MSTGIISSAIQAELTLADARLVGSSAGDILRWAVKRFGGKLVLACSFGGPSGMVLLDMVMKIAPATPVYYLDTEFLFPETYALVERAAKHYGIVPHPVRAALSAKAQATREGNALWTRDPDRCCAIRKVAPQQEYLGAFDAWITGIRRDQATTRKATPQVGWDARFALAKIAPLATWSEQDVWRYVVANDVPYNALHDRGYPSIGCTHCTRPVTAGEDARAGRWHGAEKTECGLHWSSATIDQARATNGDNL